MKTTKQIKEDLEKENKNNFWAKWLHNNYESISEEQEWETQKNCQVEFDDLPQRNKEVMIRIGKKVENQIKQAKINVFEETLKARNQEIIELIENIDIEDFLGVYCYNANSLKNKILKEINGEMKMSEKILKEVIKDYNPEDLNWKKAEYRYINLSGAIRKAIKLSREEERKRIIKKLKFSEINECEDCEDAFEMLAKNLNKVIKDLEEENE